MVRTVENGSYCLLVQTGRYVMVWSDIEMLYNVILYRIMWICFEIVDCWPYCREWLLLVPMDSVWEKQILFIDLRTWTQYWQQREMRISIYIHYYVNMNGASTWVWAEFFYISASAALLQEQVKLVLLQDLRLRLRSSLCTCCLWFKGSW